MIRISTNYYGLSASENPNATKGVHLAQSEYGWEFLLQGNPRKGITGIHSWLRQLDDFAVITDEYGRQIDLDDFLEQIEDRITLMKAGKLRDRLTVRNPGERTEYRSGGAAFEDREFS